MAMSHDKNALEEREKAHDREEGKVPVNQGANPSPNGQDEPRNRDAAKPTA